MSNPSELYTTLRRKVIEDPREATRLFVEAFNKGDAGMAEFYETLGRPPEGRLRQLVANALRNHKEKRRVLSHLIKWRSTETDEFTRRALDAALTDVDATTLSTSNSSASSDLGRTSYAYRYVSSRLRHKMRNAMLGVQLRANELNDAAGTRDTGQIAVAGARLAEAINKIGRLLENTDVDPEYFTNKVIHLETWLKTMNVNYSNQFSQVSLTTEGASLATCYVYANEYLLETAFWNIWINAQQAAADSCEIRIVTRVKAARIELTVSDNGPGFTDNDHELAFIQEYSKSGSPNRGRGLLEVQDAIERMGGTIGLIKCDGDEYRTQLKSLGSSTPDALHLREFLWGYHDLARLAVEVGRCPRSDWEAELFESVPEPHDLLRELLSADEVIHCTKRTLVHGDLHLSNIALARSTGEPRAFLIDSASTVGAAPLERDLASFEVSALLHQQFDREEFKKIARVWYSREFLPQQDAELRSSLASNTSVLVRCLRSSVSCKVERRLYALFLFDFAAIQAGGLAYGTSQSKIYDPYNACLLARGAAQLYLAVASPEILCD